MMLGIGTSTGTALRKTLIKNNAELIIEKKQIENAHEEQMRFKDAISKSRTELEMLRAKALNEFGKDKATIFDARLLLLDDPELVDNTLIQIEIEEKNAEYIFKRISDHYIDFFVSIDNDYMKERAADIKDVADRILRNLLNIEETKIL